MPATLEAPEVEAIAPVTPPAPEPSPTPEPPPSSNNQVNSMEDAFSAIDAMGREEGTKPVAPKAPEAAPVDPKPVADAPPPAPTPIAKMAPKQLREAHEALLKKHAAAEARLKEISEQPPVPADDPEKKAISERFDQAQKRLEEYETELRYANFERSDEYKTKYWAPFQKMYESGRTKAASATVLDDEGNPRPGTAKDFDDLMRFQDEAAAVEFAEKRFGKLAHLMLWNRIKTGELNDARNEAIVEFRAKGEQRFAEQREQQAKSDKQRTEAETQEAKTWARLNTEAVEKYPQLFKPDEADAKGKDLLARGTDIMERVFSDGRPLKEGQQPLGREEMIALRSAMYNKARAFDYQLHLRRTAEGRVKELETELARYRKSEPGGGNGGPPDAGELTPEQQLDRLAR